MCPCPWRHAYRSSPWSSQACDSKGVWVADRMGSETEWDEVWRCRTGQAVMAALSRWWCARCDTGWVSFRE